MAHPALRFAVDTGVALSDLADLTPDGAHWEVGAETVESTYLDTAEHDLLRAGVSLARFTGGAAGADTGWRLDLPGGPRVVTDRPRTAPATDVPAALAAATLGVRRGRDLRPVATVRVHRTLHQLRDGDGELLLELADETVHTNAPTPDGALLEEWRRWLLSPGADDTEVIAAVAQRLADAPGATAEVDETGDLQRALVGSPAVPVAPGHRAATTKGKGKAKKGASTKGTSKKEKASKEKAKAKKAQHAGAGELILAYVRAQDDALVAGDLMLRAGTGGIHPTRVATRRLRSTLRIFGPFVDADRAAAFDAELSWYAATLGEVRDREVQRVRMRALIDEIPDELVLGPVASSIDAALRSEEVLHRGRLAEALDSERYLALLREAHLWSTTPPFTPAADADASVLEKRVRKAATKLGDHLEAGLRHGGDDEELHSARKAGKRARYAAELAAPVLGKQGAGLVAQYQEIQDVLGDFQDGVVACALIRRLAAGTVGKRKENGFTYGLLYAREQQRAVAGRTQADALFAKLRG